MGGKTKHQTEHSRSRNKQKIAHLGSILFFLVEFPTRGRNTDKMVLLDVAHGTDPQHVFLFETSNDVMIDDVAKYVWVECKSVFNSGLRWWRSLWCEGGGDSKIEMLIDFEV